MNEELRKFVNDLKNSVIMKSEEMEESEEQEDNIEEFEVLEDVKLKDNEILLKSFEF